MERAGSPTNRAGVGRAGLGPHAEPGPIRSGFTPIAQLHLFLFARNLRLVPLISIAGREPGELDRFYVRFFSSGMVLRKSLSSILYLLLSAALSISRVCSAGRSLLVISYLLLMNPAFSLLSFLRSASDVVEVVPVAGFVGNFRVN